LSNSIFMLFLFSLIIKPNTAMQAKEYIFDTSYKKLDGDPLSFYMKMLSPVFDRYKCNYL